MDKKVDILGEEFIPETDKNSIGLETTECFGMFLAVIAIVGAGTYLYYII